MANKSKIFACQKGHKIVSIAKNDNKLITGRIVCGTCQTNFTEYKSANWSAEKHFICDGGHIITISPFANGQCNMSWGNGDNEFTNVSHHPDEMTQMLNEQKVACPAGKEDSPCDKVLRALEDGVLAVPKVMGIKTRVRVGDVWDKYKCPEPKIGSYDKEFRFKQTEFAKTNKARVKKIREQRNTNPAGEVIDRATKRKYRDQNPGKPDKSDL